MQKLDMMGKPCPIPVVEAKKALALPGADIVEVRVDSMVAVQNLEKMANGMSYGFVYSQNGENDYSVTLHTDGAALTPEEAAFEIDCTAENGPAPGVDVTTAGGPVVFITANQMGRGEEELGKILVKGFIFSLTQLDPLPAKVLLVNSGVFLAQEDANTVPDLKTLEDKGCEVVACGTCLNYYKLENSLAVGKVTDMLGITTRVAAAGRLITI